MLVLGIVIFALGLLLSIAWHELGHYTAARYFGIRVPQFMVGFGPTVFSRQRGETEWGVKAVPLGGFIRMIGMIPPAPGQKIGTSRRSGPFQGMIDDIRRENNADFQPGDEDRQFWTRKPWQRIVVMFAGPFMNLILAVVIFVGLLFATGITQTSATIGSVSRCVVPASSQQQVSDDACPPGAPLTPAFRAGVQPEDRVVSFAGQQVVDGGDLTALIQASRGATEMVVERGGRQLALPITLAENTVRDDYGSLVSAGYLGVGFERIRVDATPGLVAAEIGDLVAKTAHAITTLPARVDDLFRSVFLGEERDPYGPVSVVGVSVIGGQVLESEAPIGAEVATMLNLLAAVNLSLFVLNLLPILPLDGGHMVPALWEAGKKRIARWRGRPDPGPVDLAKLMPLAYGFALVIMSYGALVILADIVNPVDLGL